MAQFNYLNLLHIIVWQNKSINELLEILSIVHESKFINKSFFNVNELLPYSSLPIYLLSSIDVPCANFISPGFWGKRAGLHFHAYHRVQHNPGHRISAWLMQIDFVTNRHGDSKHPLSYSRPGQVGPSRSCFPRRGSSWLGWPRTRRCSMRLWFPRPWPAPSSWPTGGKQGSRHVWDGRHVYHWPRELPGWPVPESPAF